MLPDYYVVLEISPDASPEEVRAAYRRLAKRHHPDAGGSPDRFHALREAYTILSHPARRRLYDRQRAAARPRTLLAEPLLPPPPEAPPLQPPRRTAGPENPPRSLEDWDQMFREFDEFFERLEKELPGPLWGRNE